MNLRSVSRFNLSWIKFRPISSAPHPDHSHNLVDNLNTKENCENGNGGALLQDVSHWKEKNASISEAIVKADRHSPGDDKHVEVHIEQLQKLTTEHFTKKSQSDNATIQKCDAKHDDLKIRTVDGIPASKD